MIAGTHLYICVKRDNVEQSFLSKETTRRQWPGSNHRPLDRKSNALTTRPPHLHSVTMYLINIRSKISFRTLYGFDLNEATGVYDFITYMFCRHRKTFEYLSSPKFQFMKSRQLSDLCSKIYEKSLN